MATGKWSDLSDSEKAKYGDRAAFKAARKDARVQKREDRKEYKNTDRGYLDTKKLNYGGNAAGAERRAGRMENLQGRIDKASAAGNTERAAQLKERFDKRTAQNKAYGSYSQGDINSYNAGAFGNAKFDARDVAFLESEGYSKQQITDYANNLSRQNIAGSAQVLDGYDIHRGGTRNEDGSFNASVMGRNTDNKFTQTDMRAMFEEGLDEKEVAREMYNQMDTSTRGKKAQALLDKYMSEFETDPAVGSEIVGSTDPVTGTDPTQPGPGTGTGPGTGPGPGTGTGPGTPDDTGGGVDPVEGGDGTVSIIEDSGNTTITDSFNGGTINTGDITAGGDVSIDNANNAAYFGGDVNNTNMTGGGGSGAAGAQELAAGYVDSITGGNGSASAISGIYNSGNTDIESSFNGGDITTGDITAGGNVDIDNSNNSMYFGGDSSNINITYGADYDGPYSPMSALTMAGYGKPSNSPSANAGFAAQYIGLNNLLSGNKDPKNAAYYKANAASTKNVNTAALRTNIAQGIQNHYDKAAIQSNKYMGNMGNYVPPVFQMPEPLAPITSNVDQIAEDMEDNLQ